MEIRAASDDIVEYFEDNFIWRFQHNAPRTRPMFQFELWNKFHRTNDKLPRTNNKVDDDTEHFKRPFQHAIPTSGDLFLLKNKEEVNFGLG